MNLSFEVSPGEWSSPPGGSERHPRSDAGRRSFLRRGAAAFAAASAAFAGREAHATNPNFLPSLYPNENVLEFQTIQADEQAHVKFLVNALGADARPMPTFQNLQMNNLQQFVQNSMVFENTGVGAYLGAAAYIDNVPYLVAAAGIMDIEARHPGELSAVKKRKGTQNVLGQSPSFEVALTMQQVVDLVSPYVVSLNGGPPLTFSTIPSAENDIAILNFALALEYLEMTFYNINVPKFTG